jgi:tape measure domain-containing protein
MSNKVGEVYIEIGAIMGAFEEALVKARLKASQLDSQFQNASNNISKNSLITADRVKSMASTFAKVAAGIGAAFVGIVGMSVKSSAAMEQAAISFEVLLGSGEKAQTMLKEIADFAEKTPFEFPDLANAAQMMLNFGLAAEDIMPNLQMLGDVSGGDANKLQSLTLAFSQMSSTGRLMGQDLLQMINAGFNPLNEISKTTGKSIGQLKKEMEGGAISADMVREAFKSATSAGGPFFQMMEKQSKSFMGLWSTLGDVTSSLGRDMAGKILPVLKLIISDAITAGEGMKGMARELGSFIGQAISSFMIGYSRLKIFGAEIGKLKAEIILAADELQLKLTELNGQGGSKFASQLRADMYRQKKAIVDNSIEIIKARQNVYKYSLAWNDAADNTDKATKKTSLVSEKSKQAQAEVEKLSKELEKARDKWLKFNEEYGKSAIELENMRYAQELQDLQNSINMKAITKSQGQEIEKQLEQQHQEKLTEIAKAESDRRQQMLQTGLGITSNIVGQLGDVFSMYYDNQIQNVDNDKEKKLDALNEWYEEQQGIINSTVTDEKQRAKQLEALDAEQARKEKAINEKADKEKRKLEIEAAKRQKAINITETVIATATGAMSAYKALAGIPLVGPALGAAAAAAITALGATKVALIASQPLPQAAEGIYAESPYVGGEAGPELAFPLASERGKRAMSLMSNVLLDNIAKRQAEPTQTQETRVTEVYKIIGTRKSVFSELFTAFENGDLMVPARSVI